MLFFFFKQKTAYEMRISDWSSDVCSSDLDMKSGEAAAILIWLRCVGERGLIERSIEGFEGLPYQNARYLLISSAVLDDDSLRPLHGKVPTGLKTTRARVGRYDNEEGLPFAVRARPDILNLEDETRGSNERRVG